MSRRDSAVVPGLPATAGEALARYLHAQAGDFLRSLRLHSESGADTAGVAEAARALRQASRRISGTLHTFRPLLDPAWADDLRTELAWLSATLAQEHAFTSRLGRLLEALARLSGATPLPPARGEVGALKDAAPESGEPSGAASGAASAGASTAADGAPRATGALTVGAARAGALLERQLTLARTRAHSAALQALGSSRFHAVADAVAVLASELPLGPVAAAPAVEALTPPAEFAERRLLEAVAGLPLARAAHPYNAEALVHGLAAASAGEAQDSPWHQVRLLLRLHRYAQEVLHPEADPVLCHAGLILDRHRDAAEAAAAAATAARTPRIAPATAYALGVLHADQRHEVEAARFAFQQVWQRAPAATPVTAP
ncbi:metal-binding protein [Streptomyces lunaelactis]|uniref:Metal-binding protein n=1 Tax=Streptomyces lunaelactis TaxID=1535768 RepID=A0A2R4TEM2_9ACTN|nr:CHAD domain-containing protein [Streptomyces lunaelactis]AVZ77531.1 metal-binding protein [Streptomyces lunaelactis]NUK88318.1 CHAD domain-containing protein [Streptomyces lunaelactis]